MQHTPGLILTIYGTVMRWKTDINQKQQLCLLCYELNEIGSHYCRRCECELAQRKKRSLELTFVLALSATMLLVPANLLMMMATISLGEVTSDTLFGGVLYFYSTGEYEISIIIFLASICIPFIKLFVLYYLMYIVKFKKHSLALRGVRLYQFIRFIGKYSMLDVFVVAIMVSIVQFGVFAKVVAGEAAFFFTLAVILTILATESFDPRLLWGEKDGYRT